MLKKTEDDMFIGVGCSSLGPTSMGGKGSKCGLYLPLTLN